MYAVNRTTSEERTECSRGWAGVGGGWRVEGGEGGRVFNSTLGRIDVAVCYTPGYTLWSFFLSRMQLHPLHCRYDLLPVRFLFVQYPATVYQCSACI